MIVQRARLPRRPTTEVQHHETLRDMHPQNDRSTPSHSMDMTNGPSRYVDGGHGRADREARYTNRPTDLVHALCLLTRSPVLLARLRRHELDS